jgi:TM2 domain-containing membrane protein YozV
MGVAMDTISSSLALKSQLSTQQLALFESEMAKRRKSVALAYVLLLFLGGLGVHRFYLGFNSLAIAQLVCFILGLLTVWIGIGFVFLLFTGIVAFVDLFLTVGLTDRANQAIEQQILASLPAPVQA